MPGWTTANKTRYSDIIWTSPLMSIPISCKFNRHIDSKGDIFILYADLSVHNFHHEDNMDVVLGV